MLKLPAVLTHAVAAQVAATFAKEVAAQPGVVVVDASLLAQFDSSALAVLLECRRQAKAVGKGFAVAAAPDRLTQLARVYGVLPLIPPVSAAAAL